ncbi:hypothetical protein YC2023_107896 [Brassica napus]
METRGVDVEKRRSHRIIIFPLLFFTIINGEPLDMHFMVSPARIHFFNPKVLYFSFVKTNQNGAVFSFFSSSPSLLDGSTLHGDLISSPVLHHLIVIGRHDFVSSSPSFHFEKLPSSLAILRVVSVEQSPLSLTSQRVFEETQESRDLESNKYWLRWRV